MRILFSNTNYQRRVEHASLISVVPPLDLAYCAALVRERAPEHELRLLDANALGLDFDRHLAAIRAEQPDLIVFSAATYAINSVAALVREIKGPPLRIALIGAHGSALPEQTLQELAGLDFVVRGEPELGVIELVQTLAGPGDLAAVNGLHWREGRTIKAAPDRPLLLDLDQLPFPARDLLPNERYSAPYSGRVTALRATRGCPGQCSFCDSHVLYGARTRTRDPLRVVEEIELCLSRFDLRYFAILDHTFTAERGFVERLCNLLIERGLGRRIRWSCNTRVDMLDDAVLRLMRGAGCVEIGIGMESAVNERLAAVDKGIDQSQIALAIQRIKRAGIVALGYAIIGFPEDTAETIERTRRAIFALDPHALQLSFATPLPGSRLRQQCREQQRLLSENWDDYVFLRKSIIRNDELSAAQLAELRRKIVTRFYLRPRKLLQLAWLLAVRARVSRLHMLRAAFKVAAALLVA